MKLFLTLLLLPLTAYADVKIDIKNRVPNKSPGYCTWCSLETLGRHHNISPLLNLVENRGKQNEGSNTAIYRQLKELKINFKMQWIGNKKTDIIEYAIEKDLGCAVGFNPNAFDHPSAHMVVIIDFNKDRVKFIDPSDHKRIHVRQREWFDEYFDGTVIVIERN